MFISVVMITHDNYRLKHGCIESVILSMLNQIEKNFEIIIVDNCSCNEDLKKLQKFVLNLFDKGTVKLICNDVNNIARGRNIGIKNARSDLIVFMDDDILLIQQDALSKIEILSYTTKYGYGAVRDWTQEGWYEKNRYFLNKCFKSNTVDYRISIASPKPSVRHKKNNRHLLRTYIGNFGFATREILERVNYWDEDYSGYGAEDDDMAFKLYITYGRPALLNEISVVHIWHKIGESSYAQQENNRRQFQARLTKNGVAVFHVGRLLYNESDVIEYIDGE